ncbi:hypothetical protein AKO1_001661 [Acrasis kona]|uniref:Uncharacterized protein n=1 Tax=Acrasis kona TaxID=1008807 RepID=A0AAW2YN56_9EUKA
MMNVADEGLKIVPYRGSNTASTIDNKQVKQRFRCEKCGCSEYTTGEIRTCSNLLAKILNVQNNRYKTLTCEGCGFTQMYQATQSFLANLLDVVVR